LLSVEKTMIKPINPGDLRTRITLLSRSLVQDTGGFQTPRYTTLATVWAKWVNVHGQETWLAQTAQAEQAATVTIRYRSGVDATIAIAKGTYSVTNALPSVFTGGVFDLVSFDDIQEGHRYIEMKLKRVMEA
jgi:SPP1 family predicted phage head-tail adaptor